MIPAQHPLVGEGRAGNFCDHVVNGFGAPVGFHLQMHFCVARADVVGDAQATAPLRRRDTAGQSFKQGLRIGIGNRQDRNFCNGGGIFDLQALGIFRRAYARRQRITGIKRHVRNAAALHAILGAPRAFGKGVALHKSIFMRVGINQATDGAMFGGHFWLDAAPRMKITGDHDLALHGNTHAIELFVILGNSVVHVHERRGNVAVLRIGVVGRKLFGLLAGGWIIRQRGFLEFR